MQIVQVTTELDVPNHLGQLSLPSLRGRLIEYQPAWLGLQWGVFTCVGWKVTICDPIRQVTPHRPSSEMTCSGEPYRLTALMLATAAQWMGRVDLRQFQPITESLSKNSVYGQQTIGLMAKANTCNEKN